MSNFFAQTEALLHGKSAAVVQAEFQAKNLKGGSEVSSAV
jgi:hypothetical protein